MNNAASSISISPARFSDFWAAFPLQITSNDLKNDLAAKINSQSPGVSDEIVRVVRGIVLQTLTAESYEDAGRSGVLPTGDGDEADFGRLSGFLELFQPTTFLTCERDEDVEAFAEKTKLNVASLRNIVDCFVETNVIYHSSYPQLSTIRRPSAYQEDILTDGSLSARSPYSDTLVRSRSSFAVKSAISEKPIILFYLFDDEGKKFFAIPERLYGDFVAYYLPNEDVLISATPKIRIRPSDVAQLKALIAYRARTTKSYVENKTPRTIALLSGMLNHLGHTLLNELDACHQCATRGLFSKVDLLISGWAPFFDFHGLYPELEGTRRVEVRTTLDLHAAITSENVIAVRPLSRSFWFSDGLRERFARLCARAESVKAAGSELEDAQRRSPVLYFDIRTHDRSWKHQAEGFVSVANALVKDFPNLGIVLAGWSKFDNRPSEPDDYAMIEIDRSVAADIEAKLDRSIKSFTIVGCSPLQKAIWCDAADVFVGVYSSGMLFPSCIALKPGVLFASTHFQKMIIRKMKDRVFPYVESGRVNYFIPLDAITLIPGAVKVAESSFDVDLAQIEAGVRQLLKTSNA